MEALFLKLLNLSLTASWLVLAVLVLRLLFRKAPRWIFCLLWGLVAVRLVLPFSLESALSLIPSAEPIPADIVYQTAPMIDSGIPVVDHVVNPVISESFAPAPVASVNPLQVVSLAACWIWLLGLAAMVIYSVVSFLFLKRRVRTATILRDNIRQCETVDSPFVLGLFRPTIYLPYSMDEGNMAHVIAHEQAHIRRGDHWWKPLGFLLLAVYWFNPLLWAAYILFCRDMELACDEKVVANMEQEDRRSYSTALLNCSIRRRSVAACPLAFGEVGVKDRVKSVMHYKKPAFWIILIALLACVAAAVCFLTVPKQAADSYTLAEDGSGLPAPKGGVDPYADLEPAQRAAAFLTNAETLDYEISPFLLYGHYIVPTVKYVPHAQLMPDAPYGFDHTEQILLRLHSFDLSSLQPVDIPDAALYSIRSGVIRVGEAACRIAFYYEAEPTDPNQVPTLLVFTFADGTMCAFDGGINGKNFSELYSAYGMASSGQGYALTSTGGDMTVTQLSSGESNVPSPYSAALARSFLDAAFTYSTPVTAAAPDFGYRIEFEDGSTYLFDWDTLLVQTADGKLYSLNGFGEDAGTAALLGIAFVLDFEEFSLF